MDFVIGAAVAAIFGVALVSLVWWAMRFRASSPMTDAEKAVGQAAGTHRPHVFEGGVSYLPPGAQNLDRKLRG